MADPDAEMDQDESYEPPKRPQMNWDENEESIKEAKPQSKRMSPASTKTICKNRSLVRAKARRTKITKTSE